MAKIEWDLPEERIVRAGVDRGIISIDDVVYPWNGLVDVTRVSGETAPEEFYHNGYRYALDFPRSHEVIKINAMTYPDAFEDCIGYVGSGMHYLGTQKKPFNLSFRTGIYSGSDEESYDIHLMYDCVAQLEPATAATIGDSFNAEVMSWNVYPKELLGRGGASHFIVRSTDVDKSWLRGFETILYGGKTRVPKIPSVDRVDELLKNYKPYGYGEGLYGITPYDRS